MELLQLMYFCDAAETENFSRTAQANRVPPSDITQSIKRLETELSVQLIDRQANRVILNERGAAFYQKVRQALTLLDEAKKAAADSEEQGTIRLSIRTNRRIVMQTVRAFRQTHPMVDVAASHSIHADTKNFHLIIAEEDLSDSGLRRQKLLSEDIYLAIPRSNPLADIQDFRQLREAPFICMAPGNSIHTITMDICRRWGFTPHVAIQSDDPFYVRKCVELGLGVSIVPAVSWNGQFSENICLRRIDGVQRNTYVYLDDQKHLPASAKAFLDMLVAAFQAEETE